MFSRSTFSFLGIVIGGVAGGVVGAIAGFLLAAIISGLIFNLFERVSYCENKPDVDMLATAAKLNQLAVLKMIKNIHDLYVAGESMPCLSLDEQQAYIVTLDFFQKKFLERGDAEQFDELLNMVNTIHFKGNSILGSYLRQIS